MSKSTVGHSSSREQRDTAAFGHRHAFLHSSTLSEAVLLEWRYQQQAVSGSVLGNAAASLRAAALGSAAWAHRGGSSVESSSIVTALRRAHGWVAWNLAALETSQLPALAGGNPLGRWIQGVGARRMLAQGGGTAPQAAASESSSPTGRSQPPALTRTLYGTDPLLGNSGHSKVQVLSAFQALEPLVACFKHLNSDLAQCTLELSEVSAAHAGCTWRPT